MLNRMQGEANKKSTEEGLIEADYLCLIPSQLSDEWPWF